MKFFLSKPSEASPIEEVGLSYLTPKDLSQRYRISERQVTHLARIGYLPGFKVGKLWRFKPEDIEDWEGRQRGADEIAKLADEIIGRPC